MLLKRGDKGLSVKALQGYLHLKQDGIFGILTEEAVKDFQRKNGLKVDGIVGDKTWALLQNKATELKLSKRNIKEIIIHCTATREGSNLTAADIKKMHLARGFSDIGYHYLVYLDGTISMGRDVNIAGAHCLNHNTYSIGVAYIGGVDRFNVPKDTRTEKQKTSLKYLLIQLKKLYPKARILGHRDTSPDLNGNGLIEPKEWVKACPCFNAAEEYSNI